jgi:hypothetical protein
MAEKDPEVEQASRDLARAIWSVLLARDEDKARGPVGQATRRRLIEKIPRRMRALKRVGT